MQSRQGKGYYERSLWKDLVGEGLSASRMKLKLVIEYGKILSFCTWLTEEAQFDDKD